SALRRTEQSPGAAAARRRESGAPGTPLSNSCGIAPGVHSDWEIAPATQLAQRRTPATAGDTPWRTCCPGPSGHTVASKYPCPGAGRNVSVLAGSRRADRRVGHARRGDREVNRTESLRRRPEAKGEFRAPWLGPYGRSRENFWLL